MIMVSGKGQYFKIWDKVSIEKLQNEDQWFLKSRLRRTRSFVWSYVFCSQLVSSSTDMRMRCQAVVQALG